MAERTFMHRNLDGVFDLAKDEVAKTSSYTILPADNGTLFTNTGASGAVTFTLPALGKGYVFFFLVTADQSVTVQSAAGSDMITVASLTASSVAFTTSGNKIGRWLKVYSNAAGDKWITEQGAQSGLTDAELGVLDGVTAGTGLASKALVLDSSGNVTMPTAGIFALSRASIAAAGTTAADATVLTGQLNAVTASDNAKGVALPAAATTTGPIWVINTVANASLLVYPVNGGNDNINGLAEDAAFTLAPGEAAVFVPTSATQWYTPDRAGVKAVTITGTRAVTVAENGTTFYINNATGFATTLPAPFLGARYTFINKTANTSGNHTVVTNASANIIQGNQNSVAGDAGDTGTADDTINFVANQSLPGDKVELHSDGTSWFAYAISRVAAGITFTQAS